MALPYKSVGVKLTANTTTTIYTVPGATTIIVSSIMLSNISASSLDTIEVSIRKSGAGSDVFLNKGATIAATTSMQISGPFVLETGDILKVKAGTANVIDVFVSYSEV